MKYKLLIAALLICGLVQAQTPLGYTKINSRYDWLAGKFDSGMHVPGYSTVPVTRSGVWVGAGNIGIDTILHRIYFSSGGSFRRVANFSDLSSYQPTITLTTTGSSGPATLISNTLNIPQYSGGGSSRNYGSSQAAGLSFNVFRGHNAQGGVFWPANVVYNDFRMEFWVLGHYVPGLNGAGYFFSAGHGGAHRALIGFDYNPTGRLGVTGNNYFGVGSINDYTYTSIDAVKDSTWNHIAITGNISTGKMTLSINGVPSARIAYAPWTLNENQIGYFGGSDHNNFNGILAQARWYEDQTYETAYPQRYFTGLGAQGCWNFMLPSNIIADLGEGFYMKHPLIRNTLSPQSLQMGNPINSITGQPYPNPNSDQSADSLLPEFVPIDLVEDTVYTGPAVTVTVGSSFSDSLHRRDVVGAWRNVTITPLDSTEGGSLGKLKYSYPSGVLTGIFNNKVWAIPSFTGNYAKFVIDPGTVVDSIRVTIATNGQAENYVGLVVRYTNESNYVSVRVYGGTTYLESHIAGTTATLATGATVSGFSSMTIIQDGNNVRVYQNTTQIIGNTSVSAITASNKVAFEIGSDLTRITSFVGFN